jgi:hypothetical protein
MEVTDSIETAVPDKVKDSINAMAAQSVRSISPQLINLSTH